MSGPGFQSTINQDKDPNTLGTLPKPGVDAMQAAQTQPASTIDPSLLVKTKDGVSGASIIQVAVRHAQRAAEKIDAMTDIPAEYKAQLKATIAERFGSYSVAEEGKQEDKKPPKQPKAFESDITPEELEIEQGAGQVIDQAKEQLEAKGVFAPPQSQIQARSGIAIPLEARNLQQYDVVRDGLDGFDFPNSTVDIANERQALADSSPFSRKFSLS